MFRDPRNTITDRIIAFDGPIADIFNFQAKDQPPLPLDCRFRKQKFSYGKNNRARAT